MDGWKVITALLGLQDVFVEDVKLFTSKRGRRAEIFVTQIFSKCVCHRCKTPLERIHDYQRRSLQGPPVGVFTRVIISLSCPRGWCSRCKKNQRSYVSFIHPGFPSLTCGFAEVAGRMMEETTCEATARLLHTNSKKLWSLDQWRMQYMLERLRLPEDMDVGMLSADEVHFRTKRFKDRKGWTAKRWEAEFVTNLVCYKNSKVLFNAMGRDAKALEDCISVLSEGQRLAVEFFAVDMHDPFISVIREKCPHAEICVDRFHLAQAINRAFDEVRKAELRKAQKVQDAFQEGMLAPSRRFVLVEKKKELSKQELKMLDQLREQNTNINNAMLIVEYFHRMLEKKNPDTFRQALSKWYRLVRDSGLKEFRKFAALVRKYRHQIESYINSNLTTAVSEGINNKIKVLKRAAYGYMKPTSFRHKILQRCGFLNHYHINTDDLLYSVPNPK
ncbi:MAG: ISL3 family transposase [Bdellovibrionales bacterium]